MRSYVVVSTEKKSSFLGSRRDVFRRPSAAPEPIAPKFLHTTFLSKYFVLAEFHPPRLSFGGVMPPTPSGASLHYGLPYIMAGHNDGSRPSRTLRDDNATYAQKQRSCYDGVILLSPLSSYAVLEVVEISHACFCTPFLAVSSVCPPPHCSQLDLNLANLEATAEAE